MTLPNFFTYKKEHKFCSKRSLSINYPQISLRITDLVIPFTAPLKFSKNASKELKYLIQPSYSGAKFLASLKSGLERFTILL